MDENERLMNEFLVHAFNNILQTEERCLSKSEFSDLSMRELHTLEVVAQSTDGVNNTISHIAQALGIVPGTLTLSATALVKKGYLFSRRDEYDRRIRRLTLTEKGIAANEAHRCFHAEMVRSITCRLTPEEVTIFARGLDGLSHFFRKKNEKE